MTEVQFVSPELSPKFSPALGEGWRVALFRAHVAWCFDVGPNRIAPLQAFVGRFGVSFQFSVDIRQWGPEQDPSPEIDPFLDSFGLKLHETSAVDLDSDGDQLGLSTGDAFYVRCANTCT